MSDSADLDTFVTRLRNVAGMIEQCERIPFGTDVALMREAADRLQLWKSVADERQTQIYRERAAYDSLHKDVP
jgi:hypothetical protein